jgi:hypothetical protein
LPGRSSHGFVEVGGPRARLERCSIEIGGVVE